MNKFLYAICVFGVVSQVSASATADDCGPLSPMGRHGATNGGMCKAPFKSCDNMMQLVTTFPPAVNVRRLAADGVTYIESTIPISSTTRVVDFKDVFASLRIPSAHRVMWNGVEIMQGNTNADGTLITLADIFAGVSGGIPMIEVVMDSSRSPMMTPAPQPIENGNVSPIKVD